MSEPVTRIRTAQTIAKPNRPRYSVRSAVGRGWAVASYVVMVVPSADEVGRQVCLPQQTSPRAGLSRQTCLSSHDVCWGHAIDTPRRSRAEALRASRAPALDGFG